MSIPSSVPSRAAAVLAAVVVGGLCTATADAQTWAGTGAANLDVVQNDALNNTTSVTVTAVTSINGLTVRAGSNRGDYNMAASATPANDFLNGVMITSVRQNGRNNFAFGDSFDEHAFATSMADADAGGLFIPVAHSQRGSEFNINVAAGYFHYSAGWVGGHLRNATNNGPLVPGSSSLSPGLTLGAEGSGSSIESTATAGVYRVDLAGVAGPGASQNGILLVTGGRNEDNFALSGANPDGTFNVWVKDNGTNSTATEQDGFSFVYVPNGVPGIVSGRVSGAAVPLMSSGDFVVSNQGTGTILLTIAGVTGVNDGVLLISPEREAGGGLTDDNIVTYEWDDLAQGWFIQTRDLTGPDGTATIPGLQDVGGIPAFSFVYIPSTPIPEPATVALFALAAAAGLVRGLRRRAK